MDGWNTTFLLGRPIFRGEPLVSGRVLTNWNPAIIIFSGPKTFPPDCPWNHGRCWWLLWCSFTDRLARAVWWSVRNNMGQETPIFNCFLFMVAISTTVCFSTRVQKESQNQMRICEEKQMFTTTKHGESWFNSQPSKKNIICSSGWWFQPIWKILVNLEIFPK